MRSKLNTKVRMALCLVALICGCRRGTTKTSPMTTEVAANSQAIKSSDGQMSPQKEAQLKRAAWGSLSPEWSAIERLEKRQVFKTALQKTTELKASFERADDERNQVEAIIRIAKHQHRLGKYEAAIQTLSLPLSSSSLEANFLIRLSLIQALDAYLNRYSGTISNRERRENITKKDISLMTRRQLIGLMDSQFQFLWSQRESLRSAKFDLLKTHLKAGTYPDSIHVTLLDVLVYFWSEWLKNTRYWKPSAHSQLYTVNLFDLSSNNSHMLVPTDSSSHPLVRYASLLRVYEDALQHAQRDEAALAAFVQGTVGLVEVIENEETKRSLLDALKLRLETELNNGWWTMGMASLAVATSQLGYESAKFDSYQLAKSCVDKGSPGPGRDRCEGLVHNLKGPSFSIEMMRFDAQDRRSVDIRYKNLETLRFRAWKIKTLPENLNFYNEDERKKYFERKPDFVWEVELPETTNLRERVHSIIPPIDEFGHYFVHAYVDTTSPSKAGHFGLLTLNNLIVRYTQGGGERKFRVHRADTGHPIAGAKMTLYKRVDHSGPWIRAGRYKTDKEGRLLLGLGTIKPWNSYFVVAAKKGFFRARSNRFYANERGRETLDSYTQGHVFTDRKVYRPGQTVQFQLVALEFPKNRERAHAVANESFTVRLVDVNGQTVESLKGKTNRFGTWASSFRIPSEGVLGRWSIFVSSQKERRMVYDFSENVIFVEAFKRPTFEVSLSGTEAPLVFNQTATVLGEAKYYFGQPLSTGTVSWTVLRRPMYRPWWHKRSFLPLRKEIIADGQSSVGDDGQFFITFKPKADPNRPEHERAGLYYSYEVTANVTNEGGETRTMSRTFYVGYSNVELKVEPKKGFFTEDENIEFEILRKQLSGQPLPGKGEWTVYSLKQPSQTPLPSEVAQLMPLDSVGDDSRFKPTRLKYKYDSHHQALAGFDDAENVASGTVLHSENGVGVVRLSALPAGSYRLRYRTLDAHGRSVEYAKAFLVVGNHLKLQVPVAFVLEKDKLNVGETCRIFVHSGFPDAQLFVSTYFGPSKVHRQQFTGGELIEFVIKPEHRGGINFELTFIYDHHVVRLPLQLAVPFENKKLSLRLETFRDVLQPGTDEEWRLVVRDHEGNPVDGEVLAYLYDQSLDLYVEHRPPDLASEFGGRWFQSETWMIPQRSDSLFSFGRQLHLFKSVGFPYRGPSLNSFSGAVMGVLDGRRSARYGRRTYSSRPRARVLKKSKSIELNVDGDETATLEMATKPIAEPKALRKNFAETAFFLSQQKLDPDGRLALKFRVPDAVTRWKLHLHAFTRRAQYGFFETTVETKKQLLVRPYLPRFLREGDSGELRVVIDNLSDSPQTGTFKLALLDAEGNESVLADFGLKNQQVFEQTFTLKSGESTTIHVPLKAPSGLRDVTVRVFAQTESHRDGEQRTLTVVPGRFHLAQSQFALLGGKQTRTFSFPEMTKNDDPTRRSKALVIGLHGRLFEDLVGALPYLLNYPYESTLLLTEKVLATGILDKIYRSHPPLAKQAREQAKRKTIYSSFDGADANRSIKFEETPWLRNANGGAKGGTINTLMPKTVKETMKQSISKLRSHQKPDGGFPWFPGGRASSAVTLSVLTALAKAQDFGVVVPKELVRGSFRYLWGSYEPTLRKCMAKGSCAESVANLCFLLSVFSPDFLGADLISIEKRNVFLDYGFLKWRELSAMTKGYLALSLKNANRLDDARKVWRSVLDSSEKQDGLGTFWKPEAESWRWYRDTVETHAFALRVTMALEPTDPKLDGMVEWLFLN